MEDVFLQKHACIVLCNIPANEIAVHLQDDDPLH